MIMSFWKLLADNRIIIPILQRDYVQGRTTGKAPIVRENLLNAIFTALDPEKAGLELDFIYGYTENFDESLKTMKKTFFPLDGQQRLTTLFLLHWFIAVHEDCLDEQVILQLAKFSYHTRPGSRDFCGKLAAFKPDNLHTSIRETIINQPWFFAAWTHDPTIASMLTMLDDIQKKTKQFSVQNIWPVLISDQAPITFHVLHMDELGLPDDLYIKMNSRGKALTEFEYFKARFSEQISPEKGKYFNEKVDQAWSDLFWDRIKHQKSPDIAQRVDESMMRFIRYITDMLVAKGQMSIDRSKDTLSRYGIVYHEHHASDFLFKVLDDFYEMYKFEPEYFSKYFYINDNDYSLGRTKLFFEKQSPDLFQKCAERYYPTGTINPFSLSDQLLLYGCIIHRTKKTKDFEVRIRQLRNLLYNSVDTIRAEYLHSLISSVESIIQDGQLDGHANLNTTQIEDEKRKAIFLGQFPHLREPLERLEDHQLLQGCLAIIQLTPDLAAVSAEFIRFFHNSEEYDLYSCALISRGDYSQQYGTRRRFGNRYWTVWRELFTPSRRKSDYDKTQKVLADLLNMLIKDPNLTATKLLQSWQAQFETSPNKEKDWRYYYIKYADFRKNEKGFYHWPDTAKLYESTMILSIETSGKNWDPFLYTIKNRLGHQVTIGNYSSPLIISNGLATMRLFNKNEGFQFEAVDSDSQMFLVNAVENGYINDQFMCPILQSEAGLDIEDRVQVGIELFKKISEIEF